MLSAASSQDRGSPGPSIWTVSTMVPVLLSLLLLLGPAAPKETQAGNYSLSFLYTGLSKPRQGSPRFQAVAYLNDQPFFHYDSEGRRAEPLAPWSQVEGMEDWEKESALQRAREDIFMETLSDIMDYYKDSEGSHTFQGAFGCELRNNEISGAFWVYAYDRRDFIKFNKEIPAWVPLDPAAQNTKRKWEAEAIYVQRAKAYLEEECPGMLQRYLPYSRTHLDRQGARCRLCPALPHPALPLRCWERPGRPQSLPLCWSPATPPRDTKGHSSAWPTTSTREASGCTGLGPATPRRLSQGATCSLAATALTSPGWWWGSPLRTQPPTPATWSTEAWPSPSLSHGTRGSKPGSHPFCAVREVGTTSHCQHRGPGPGDGGGFWVVDSRGKT